MSASKKGGRGDCLDAAFRMFGPISLRPSAAQSIAQGDAPHWLPIRLFRPLTLKSHFPAPADWPSHTGPPLSAQRLMSIKPKLRGLAHSRNWHKINLGPAKPTTVTHTILMAAALRPSMLHSSGLIRPIHARKPRRLNTESLVCCLLPHCSRHRCHAIHSK